MIAQQITSLGYSKVTGKLQESYRNFGNDSKYVTAVTANSTT